MLADFVENPAGEGDAKHVEANRERSLEQPNRAKGDLRNNPDNSSNDPAKNPTDTQKWVSGILHNLENLAGGCVAHCFVDSEASAEEERPRKGVGDGANEDFLEEIKTTERVHGGSGLTTAATGSREGEDGEACEGCEGGGLRDGGVSSRRGGWRHTADRKQEGGEVASGRDGAVNINDGGCRTRPERDDVSNSKRHRINGGEIEGRRVSKPRAERIDQLKLIWGAVDGEIQVHVCQLGAAGEIGKCRGSALENKRERLAVYRSGECVGDFAVESDGNRRAARSVEVQRKGMGSGSRNESNGGE